MTTMTIQLDDATDLVSQDWFAPLAKCSIRLSVREINLVDARDAGGMLCQDERVGLDLYGFRPIPAGGIPVTNELVNKLRENLEI